jgi:hypothetical protein
MKAWFGRRKGIGRLPATASCLFTVLGCGANENGSAGSTFAGSGVGGIGGASGGSGMAGVSGTFGTSGTAGTDTGGASTGGGAGGGSATVLEHRRLAIDNGFSCLLRESGEVTCWGASAPVLGPEGGFIKIAAGVDAVCAVREGGTLACYGERVAGEPVPTEQFDTLELDTVACGVTTIGELRCWGSDTLPAVTDAPSGSSYTDVGVSAGRACVIDADGQLRCWGIAPFASSAGDRFEQIALGPHMCAIRATGGVWCEPLLPDVELSLGDYGQAQPPAGVFIQVSGSRTHTCGIREDRSIECWGAGKRVSDACAPDRPDECGMAIAPEGTFDEVATAPYHSCGLRTTGGVACWGTSPGGATIVPEDLR